MKRVGVKRQIGNSQNTFCAKHWKAPDTGPEAVEVSDELGKHGSEQDL